MSDLVSFDFATSGEFKGICAAAITKQNSTSMWPKRRGPDGLYPQTMPMTDLVDLAMTLFTLHEEGHYMVGWGSLGYDCKLLYEESPAKEEIFSVAMNHVDLLFILFAATGSLISLETAAKAASIILTPKFGKTVPDLWKKDGQSQTQVLDHLGQATSAIYVLGDTYRKTGNISWFAHGSQEYVTAKMGQVTNWTYIYPSCFMPKPMLNNKFYEMTAWIRAVVKEQASGEEPGNLPPQAHPGNHPSGRATLSTRQGPVGPLRGTGRNLQHPTSI